MEEGKKGKRVVNWSELPSEILLEIGKRLGFRLDVLRFRSVCKSWRESLPCKLKINKGDNFIAVPKPPMAYGYGLHWLNGFRPEFSDKAANNEPVSIVLSERTVHVIRPKDSQLNCRGSCRRFGDHQDWSAGRIMEFEEILPNTFQSYRIDSRYRMTNFCKVVNMVDDFSVVSPISKHYGLVALAHLHPHPQEGGGNLNNSNFGDCFKFYEGCFDFVDKVVVLSKKCNYTSIMCPINDGDDGGGVVVGALLPRGNVGLLRLLGADLTPDPAGWRLVNFNHNDNCGSGSGSGKGVRNCRCRFDDIADLGGRLCVIDYNGRAYVVDSSSLELTEIAAAPRLCHVEGLQLLERRKRLVQHSGDLYMLIPCRCQVRGALRPQIKVYKLKARTREWVEVVSLGDLAIFVGKDFSFAAPATSILRKAERYRNCILFLRTSFPLYAFPFGDHLKDSFFKELSYLDVAAFDLPDGSNFRLAFDRSKDGLISADNCNEIVYWLPCCLAYEIRKQLTRAKSKSQLQRHNKDAVC